MRIPSSVKHAALAACVLLASPAHAEPSAAIAAAMGTPASAFDMYLFRVYESAKCKNWIGVQDTQPDPCMTALNYDAESNLLRMHFEMYPTNEALGDFIESDDDDLREQIMTAQIERLSKRAGVVDTWGMLHSIPLSSSAGTPQDGAAFSRELAAHTELHLHVTYGAKVFTATRTPDGLVDVDVTVRRTN